MNPTSIPITVAAEEVKVGWQTSEFWMAAVTSLIVLLNSAFNWHIDPTSLAVVAGMVASYVLSRTIVKKAPPVVVPIVAPARGLTNG